jgi:uncharacterized membrane protein
VNKKTLLGATVLLLSSGAARWAMAQDAPLLVEVTQDVKHDISPPLRDLPVIHDTRMHPVEAMKIHPWNIPFRPDPVVQGAAVEPFQPTQGLNFAGVGNGDYGFTPNAAPPDTNGSVGATQYVHWVNTSFAVFNKSGTLLYGPAAGNTLWSGFGGGCQSNNDGDIIVLWDKQAQRWLMSQFSVSSTPYLQCVAISTTSDATGTWYRYAFQQNAFNDYPKIGVWPDAYYASFNMFAGGTTFSGAAACAFQRSAMLTGATATQQCFQLSTTYFGLLPSDLDGSTPPPAGSPNYYVAFASSGSSLDLWKFHVDWTTPSNSSFSGPTAIAVASFNPACNGGGTCIPQSGTSQKLDSLADRLMYRLAYRNFGDHESLVVNHTVTAGSSAGIRWYELRSPGSNPSVYQQGTYAPDSSYRWMGSIAMDGSGDMALGYSVSSSSLFPSIRYTGRVPTDALGTMETEASLKAGGGSQSGQSLSRWGDYSSMSVDPSDDCTFWYTQEYLKSTGAFNWSTQVGTFKFPNCGGSAGSFSISASPSSVTVTQGSSGNSTITTTISGSFNSAIALSASGLPSGATASFNPTSIGAPGSGSSTLTLSTASTTPTGSYNITVTGTGGGVTQTTTVSLTVNPATSPDFTISASPSSVSIAQGASGSSTISTTVSGGFNSAISLSASGLPAGTTASFSPTSIPAPGSGSSTLTFTVGSSTATGTYSVTVTGTGGGVTHTTSISLTVTSGGTPSFTISASPSSVSIAQGASGSSTISTTVSGGFNSSISLSASGLPSGTTASFNPASIPAPGSGSSTLTFTVGSSTATGTYSVTVTGTGGGVTHTTSISLTVTSGGTPSFTISASPSSVTIMQGGSGTSTISTTVSGGFNSSISLSASGLPSGTTASFNPASIPAPGSGSSTLTFTVGSSTATGTYSVTVTGTGGGITHTTGISLTVSSSGGGGSELITDGGFESATSSGNSAPGWTATTNISGRKVIVYHGAYPHTGSNYANEGGSNRERDTLIQMVSVPVGTTSAPVTFWANIVTQETTTTRKYDYLYVEVHNSSGTLLSTLKTLSNLDATSDGNTNGTYFQVSAGDLSTWAGQTIRLEFRSTADSSLPTTFRIDDVSVMTNGGGGGNPNFSISASPSSLSIAQGASGNSTVSTAVSGGFNAAIALSASGLPSGASASFNPATIAAPGSGSSTMTITAGSSTPTGTYSVTVTGTGGGITQSTTVSLTITSGGGGGGQLITDGGFESATSSGLSAPGWTATTAVSGENVIIYQGTYPHTGTNYAFEGYYNYDDNTLTQTVSIPSGISSASLTFWVNVVTQEYPNTGPYDFLYVEIHNASGTLLATPLTLTNNSSTSSNNTDGVYFQPAAINLASFAGQTIQIVFHATTDVSLPTTFRIDDVSLVAQ